MLTEFEKGDVMRKLERSDLFSLEDYHSRRANMRTKVMAHKSSRYVHIGKHILIAFEDRLTIQYQIQEMLRVERIFETEAIDEELLAYNPLIPDGNNLKATFMLRFDDPVARRSALRKLVGIEKRVWLAFNNGKRIFAIADEDLERSDENKTSAVHFLRFQLDDEEISIASKEDIWTVGIDHVNCEELQQDLSESTVSSLREDFFDEK
jgi:hypothetical protein